MSKVALLLLIFTAFPSVALATTKSEVKINEGKSRVNVDVQSNISSSNQTIIKSNSNININTSSSGQEQVKVNIQNNKFEIKGKINSYSDNNLNVSGQGIKIDQSKVANFKKEGELGVGKTVEVKGVVIDNNLYAQEIILEGSSLSPNPSSIPSPITEPSPTSASSPSSIPAQVKEKIISQLNNLIAKIREMIAKLQEGF